MFSDVLQAIILIAVGAAAGGLVVFLRRKRPKRSGDISIFSSIQQLRSIGQLSVFKAVTKEIVTETDHSWGNFGKKYLSWVLSQKKMAMIFEFEIDFRYDLRRSEFQIAETGPSSFKLTLPPCIYEVHIRDIKFYDEQGSKLMPWLLPDLLNGFLSGGFSEEDKNNLIRSAKNHAEKEARKLIDTLQTEVQSSARAVLQSIGKAFGAQSLDFEFKSDEHPEMSIAYPSKAA